MTCNPDEAAVIIQRLRMFMANNTRWSLDDVNRMTCVPVSTLYGWTSGRTKKPNAQAHLEALERWLDSMEARGY